MEKIKSIVCLTSLLLAVMFCTVSCERPEIKPEQQDNPEDVSVTTNADRFVGTWVRYWSSDHKDTLRFSNNGIFVYSLGEYNSDGSVYKDEYYYECSNNFLFYYKDPSSYGFDTHFIKFYDGDTAFTLYNFTLYPGVEPAVVYNVTYKKID
jgi:hypothetical protein